MKRIVLLCLAFLTFQATQAQHFELGAMVGISNYRGELAPDNIWSGFSQTHAAYGGFLRYNVNNYIAGKFNVYYGTVSGDDAKANIEEQRQRNLSFKSGVLEFGLTAEFNILGFQPYNLERVFSPYIFAGIDYFRFNPKTFYDGKWYDLQPLSTEGQGLAAYPERANYDLNAFAIPFGLGVKYALNDTWNIGFEAGVRKTFTDYLDDVSTTYVDSDVLLAERGEIAAALNNRSGSSKALGDGRGDVSNDDWYFMAGIFVSYNFLDNGLVGSRGRNSRRNGCQTF